MNIRPSLRIYVLIAMLVTGISTILVLSALSMSYFISGMDAVMSGSMHEQSQEQEVSDGHPVTYLKYTIASRWQDLPPLIQSKFAAPPQVNDDLLKIDDRTSIFSRPEASYFVMRTMKGEQIRYVATIFRKVEGQAIHHQGIPHVVLIAFTAIAGIALFTLILILVMRKVASPVEKLKNWAKALDQKQLAQPIPDFHFIELTTLANIVKDSLLSVQEGVEREQQFLGYASHELRTPIAVTRANSELLQKLIAKGSSPEKQLQVLERITRAALTMTDLTETLLWLNRREMQALQPVALDKLTKQLVNELNYLANGKSVEISVKFDRSCLLLAETPCRIVLNNIIRNALQHTLEGEVSIVQAGATVTVINRAADAEENKNALGFGLGLQLTQRLVQQYGWHCESNAIANGREVRISFLAGDGD
ncbi:MAG TPA: HAMP domain-containing sensor histidine kinase [Psychromonas sp.]